MDPGNLEKTYFDPSTAKIFRLAASPWPKILRKCRLIALVFLGLSLLGSIGAVVMRWRPFLDESLVLGVSFVCLGLFWLFYLQHLFYVFKIAGWQPKRPLAEILSGGGNLAEGFSFELAEIAAAPLASSAETVKSLWLAHSLVIQGQNIDFILGRMGLSRTILGKRIKMEIDRAVWADESVEIEGIVKAAAEKAIARQGKAIKASDLLGVLFRFIPFLDEILIEQELSAEDIGNITEWYERIKNDLEKARRFWDYDNLIQKGSLAGQWAAAYTLTIDEYSRDISKIARERGGRPDVFGHEEELEQVENILAGSGKNNVLLVGQPGSGRLEVVKSLAAKSFWGSSLPALNGKRVMELDIASVVARAPSLEEVELILDNCFREAVAMSNVILVIRDLENFVGETRVGAVDISGLLAKYLESPRFQVIAIASYAGLHRQIQKMTALLNLFNKVEVSPPSSHQTLRILEYLVPAFEQRYGKFIPYLSLKRVVERSARYLQDKPFPQKSIDLLDEVMVYASRQPGSKYVDPDWVDEVISQRAEIPVGRIQSSEKEMLLNLEDLIHQRVVNQEEAVAEVSSALRRARAEVTTRRAQPMGVFLFLGPTGVGKTETAKALSDIYFGSVERMVRIDMSEFQDAKDVYRLIGDKNHVGLLTSQIRENPFSLLLLDEIEKAHPDILNLFLTVFDEGYITDGYGQKVFFSDTIIVATSNAGAEIIRRDIEADMTMDMVKDDLVDHLMKESYFRPELINRFTAVVVFKVLTKEHLMDISQLMLDRLNESLSAKGIEFQGTEQLKEKIIELGYRPAFGAREMERVVHDKIANPLAQALLKDEIKRGDLVTVDPDDFSVKLLKP